MLAILLVTNETELYMNKENNMPGLLQYISVIVASILPIAQLFFSKLPHAITQIFISPQYFTGVSIVTLILTYTLIIAYLSKPWFMITLPFQKKASEKYSDYLSVLNEVSQSKTEAQEEISSTKKTIKPVTPPRQLRGDNLISISVVVIFINAVSFVILGQVTPSSVIGIIQSINYILLLCFSALVLTVYRNVSQNNKQWRDNQKTRTNKAIELATIANCFGDIPQVKLISAFSDKTIPSNYHVFVEYKEDRYEIITDNDATYIIAAYKII